jgi:signal transduction histidine kinase
MNKPPIPFNEAERLKAVEAYLLTSTTPEKDFDDIARIASEICNVPIALISLLGEDKQWFKAHYGTDFEEMPRDIAFCSYAIMEPERPLVIPDLRLDERFRDHPLVVGPTQVVFYAGVTMKDQEGYAVGTICIVDQKPNQLDDRQLAMLQSLANTVSQLFELRRKVKKLQVVQKKLEELNQEVSEIAYVLSHDMKSPLNGIVSLLEVIKEENGSQMDESGQELLSMVHESANNLNMITKGTIQYFNTTRSFAKAQDDVNIHELIVLLLTQLHPPVWVNIHYSSDLPNVSTSKVALQHILYNLLDNAIKYNDKEKCEIKLEVTEKDIEYEFSVTDNGPGIAPANQIRVFKLFQTLGRTDRLGKPGTGLGLAIVKRMVERLGGKISISTPESGGARFAFSILKHPI